MIGDNRMVGSDDIKFFLDKIILNTDQFKIKHMLL